MAQSMEALANERRMARCTEARNDVRSSDLESRLRRAIEREEIELAYQPLADVDSLTVTGFEALARWRDEDGKLIPPIEFIAVAEETGLIVPLGELVLRMACRQAAAWRVAGVIDVPISVNLSAHQLLEPNLAQVVLDVLHETNLSPSRLKLELTETSLLRSTAVVRDNVLSLHRAGVCFALDDFGTGYSSLSHLTRFPIDTLKIDKTFIQAMIDDPGAASIVNAIVTMAHALKMHTIAEGVETREQLLFLRAYRCDGLQGYLFSPPLFPLDIPPFIQRTTPT